MTYGAEACKARMERRGLGVSRPTVATVNRPSSPQITEQDITGPARPTLQQEQAMARPLTHPFNEVTTDNEITVRGKDVPEKWRRYAKRHKFAGKWERQDEPAEVVAEHGPLYRLSRA